MSNSISSNQTSTSSPENKCRVKLYVLNAERSWDDKGTGYVTADPSPESPTNLALIVRSESDATTFLLESKVLADTAYQKQQETLIVWSDGENCDLALSFQEKSGCDEIWEKICETACSGNCPFCKLEETQPLRHYHHENNEFDDDYSDYFRVQGIDPSVEVTQDVSYEDGSDDNDMDSSGPSSQPSNNSSLSLPPCSINKLNEIQEFFASCLHSPIKRENLAISLESEKYVPQLIDTFKMCEDMENIESLHLLYQIIKNIFMLNKNALFEVLFSEETLKDVIGILEYDPNQPGPLPSSDQQLKDGTPSLLRRKHRNFLYEQARFKQVIPIPNPELKAKIHQTYRVQYIQEVMLPAPSIFEENMLSSLSSFVFFNKVEIVSLIQEDEAFLRELFADLCRESTDGNRRKELCLFLKEFCSFSQTLQPQARETFFKTLSNFNILDAVKICLEGGDQETRCCTIEIFAMVVDYSPTLVREHILMQSKSLPSAQDDSLLLNVVIRQLFHDSDPELSSAMQLLNIIRILVDPENMMAGGNSSIMQSRGNEKSEFLRLFYQRCMGNLCKPLLENTDHNKPAKDDYHTAHNLSLILDVLSFCIEHHLHFIRMFITNNNILKRVCVLLQSRHTFLALGALRLIRRVVQLKDGIYNQHIVNNNLFAEIVAAFKLNGNRYNLLNSAILELFEFITTESITQLSTYFCENWLEEFDGVDYVPTFKNMKIRYNAKLEASHPKESYGKSTGRDGLEKKLEPREPDAKQESWFESNDDDDEWEDGVPPTDQSPSSSPKTPSPTKNDSGETDLPSVVRREGTPRPSRPLPGSNKEQDSDSSAGASRLSIGSTAQFVPSFRQRMKEEEENNGSVFSGSRLQPQNSSSSSGSNAKISIAPLSSAFVASQLHPSTSASVDDPENSADNKPSIDDDEDEDEEGKVKVETMSISRSTTNVLSKTPALSFLDDYGDSDSEEDENVDGGQSGTQSTPLPPTLVHQSPTKSIVASIVDIQLPELPPINDPSSNNSNLTDADSSPAHHQHNKPQADENVILPDGGDGVDEEEKGVVVGAGEKDNVIPSVGEEDAVTSSSASPSSNVDRSNDSQHILPSSTSSVNTDSSNDCGVPPDPEMKDSNYVHLPHIDDQDNNKLNDNASKSDVSPPLSAATTPNVNDTQPPPANPPLVPLPADSSSSASPAGSVKRKSTEQTVGGDSSTGDDEDHPMSTDSKRIKLDDPSMPPSHGSTNNRLSNNLQQPQGSSQ